MILGDLVARLSRHSHHTATRRNRIGCALSYCLSPQLVVEKEQKVNNLFFSVNFLPPVGAFGARVLHCLFSQPQSHRTRTARRIATHAGEAKGRRQPTQFPLPTVSGLQWRISGRRQNEGRDGPLRYLGLDAVFGLTDGIRSGGAAPGALCGSVVAAFSVVLHGSRSAFVLKSRMPDRLRSGPAATIFIQIFSNEFERLLFRHAPAAHPAG
jgi:hypothetical protein